jgi:hypothetical protein
MLEHIYCRNNAERCLHTQSILRIHAILTALSSQRLLSPALKTFQALSILFFGFFRFLVVLRQ